MSSRSDACRCDAEGYPHPMASTGNLSGSLCNSGTRALGDGERTGHPQLWANIYNQGRPESVTCARASAAGIRLVELGMVWYGMVWYGMLVP